MHQRPWNADGLSRLPIPTVGARETSVGVFTVAQLERYSELNLVTMFCCVSSSYFKWEGMWCLD